DGLAGRRSVYYVEVVFALTKWLGATVLTEAQGAIHPTAGALRARAEGEPPRALRRSKPPSSLVASAALEGVSLEYESGVQVLADVSLDVAPGEALCLVGPSGGGKSTILNLLAGLVKPTRGRVLFDGREVDGPGPERAVVFQDAALFPWLTLEKNVAFPLEMAGVPVAERAARGNELLRLVRLSRLRA